MKVHAAQIGLSLVIALFLRPFGTTRLLPCSPGGPLYRLCRHHPDCSGRRHCLDQQISDTTWLLPYSLGERLCRLADGAQIGLTPGIASVPSNARFSRFQIPLGCFLMVLGNAFAISVRGAQAVLGYGIALFLRPLGTTRLLPCSPG